MGIKLNNNKKAVMQIISLKQRLKKFDKNIHSGEVMRIDKLVGKEKI
ncbi:hypothetical protein THERMOT_455 [Bathymodiolus thermophilus thioautotrophic gill symbiont]|nr:hypothetical protein [Bathymodiolus thermophilus thioautotrophic gill symbiont]CAB5496121.1 hypothetical protein THERMOT_455 [Bathymodiolus thermophilus thioautotrophic gill symbiont]